MSILEYNKALRLGEKEYNSAVSKGQYPYLPVLDDILSHVNVESQVNLGLVSVPLHLVVGTYSAGRTTAFARNFMPILDDGSEFSSKWGTLYDSLEEEGLRDPIKAYEYKNKFYVMEGNKRVSVLKFMDAVSIEATVTRVIPKRNNDDPDNRLYYEFLDFYELTKINYVAVSKEGTYKKLLLNTGHDLEHVWSEEEEQDFHSLYTYFEQEFNQKSRGSLSIGAGDALAQYLVLFDYASACEKTQTELRKDIHRIWNEFEMINSQQAVTLLLNPTEESKKQSFMNLLPVNTPVLKIAFIHDKAIQNSGWTYSHELGRKYIQDVFDGKIIASCIERVDTDNADDVFEAAIEAGNKVIFSTTPKLSVAAAKAAINHPEVKILNCSMLLNHKLVRSYYLRMYEGKFISGAIAGAITENNKVGYLSDYPIRGTTAEINAFALGVQMTNPNARVKLEWTMLKDRNPFEEFKKENVTIISGRDLNATIDQERIYGLFEIKEDGSHNNLCMPVRHWGKLYEEIIGSVLRGAYKNDDSVVGQQALNYFWGMSSGAVDVIYSRNLPAGCIRLLRNLREGIKNMNISPFTGPFYAQDGTCKCEDGHVLDPQQLVVIDWLLDNIDGYLPTVEELKDEAIELVKLQGVNNIEASLV